MICKKCDKVRLILNEDGFCAICEGQTNNKNRREIKSSTGKLRTDNAYLQ